MTTLTCCSLSTKNNGTKELSNLNVWNNLKIETFASPLSGPILDVEVKLNSRGISFSETSYSQEGFEKLVVHAFGGPPASYKTALL